ncbi:MAG: hypothetical protein JXQ71_18100 [Verrucomicrobia bacterium]|nr:hypothetical protein [Verrucomicrobiota bacterium]
MNTKPALIATVLLSYLACPCGAQWLTQHIPLVPGWNAVFLEVQPEPRACEEVFKNMPIESVWKWDRRFSTMQFNLDPAVLLPEAPDWRVWLPPTDRRAFLSRLFELQGSRAYLVKVATNAIPFMLAVKGRVMLPNLDWYPHSLNLVGFPVHPAHPPTFTDFFRFTPEVDTSRYYANELYRIDALGVGQRIVQPARDHLQPGAAYWIGCARAPAHHSALHVTPKGVNALDFGEFLVQRDLSIKNTHPSSAITVWLRQQPSEDPPPTGGFPELAGPVPLSYLAKNDTNEWVWNHFPATGLSRTLAAGEEWVLRMGVRRVDLAPYEPQGTNGAAYQSILEVTDAGQSLLIRIPALVKKPADVAMVGALEAHDDNEGLWVGLATVGQVNAPAYTNSLLNTPAPISFRLLVHVDGYAQARLLQQVVLAWDNTLTNAPHTNGTYALWAGEPGPPADATDLSRISSVAFPVMPPLLLDGVFTNVLSGTIELGCDDPTNPFLHRYHPMHDNLDWSYQAHTNAVETRTNSRALILAFNPITNGCANPYYGADLVSGTYHETMSGLRAQPIVMEGTFSLRRISRINQLQGMTP